MSTRERSGGGPERGSDGNYRGNYGPNSGGRGTGSFRGGRGGYNKPRRYWDNDEYYKDDNRDHGSRSRTRNRRRSYSRSRSYSSSRSRSPPPNRRGRSRSRSPLLPHHNSKPEEYVPRPTSDHQQQDEPYIPTVAGTQPSRWGVMPQQQSTNGGAPTSYGNYVTPQYQENQGPLSSNDDVAMAYGYMSGSGGGPAPTMHSMYQGPPDEVRYPHHQHHLAAHASMASQLPPPVAVVVSTSIPPPPIISEGKGDIESSVNKKKKESKKKKKKRHHSSSSDSSSSDDDEESESRKKRKAKKDNSDSSSEEETKEKENKKDAGSSENNTSSGAAPGLTTQQKDALLKQRESYQTKLDILEREIGKLQDKEDDLIRARASRVLVDENLKLQAELKGRCKAVVIVLEKIDDVLRLNGNRFTGNSGLENKNKEASIVPPPVVVPTASTAIPQSIQPQQREPESKWFGNDGTKNGLTPFDYFDSKEHWCRLCNVFPESVEQMLTHFHSKEHHDQIQQLGIDEKPWHKRSSGSDLKPTPGAKKVPFRGMQFFSPVQGWYCRLCNAWMGDSHCVVEHLKSDEHNSNYMSFLEEHPDWERKWCSDREKALETSGNKKEVPKKSSRYDQEINSYQHQQELDGGKSIRVQMRNALKGSEEKEIGGQYLVGGSSSPSNDGRNKDTGGLEEWMKKPKMAMDIIDTQKFAAIVRQKHGAGKDKEGKDSKTKDIHEQKDSKVAPAAPNISSEKEPRDSKRFDDRKRTEKVELQISSRDNNKDRGGGDRYRESRDSRGSRRRTPPRSRSKSPRDRRYSGRRRSRTRSPRSRSRDRSDRGRNSRNERETRDRDRDHHRDRPSEVKESVRKLPMIGKMPLYKRPFLNKDKGDSIVEQSDNKTKDTAHKLDTATSSPIAVMEKPVGFSTTSAHPGQGASASSMVYVGNETSVSYPQHTYENVASEYGSFSEAHHHHQSTQQDSDYLHHHIDTGDSRESSNSATGGKTTVVDGKDPETGSGPVGLPDDFKQALDLIYNPIPPASDIGGPKPVPPPGMDGVETNNGIASDSKAVSEYGTDYSSMADATGGANGYGSYMGYAPYSQSFEGYAPYEELDDGPPGDGPPGTSSLPIRPPHNMMVVDAHGHQKEAGVIVERILRDPPPPVDRGDDDMEDLRMLGIDVDDTAVVK